MIIATEFIPQKFDAITVWPCIFVRPVSLGDAGLITHELVHYREQRACGVLPWLLLYLLSKSFRLAAEVRGYRAQIAAGGITLEAAAGYLVQYGVGVTIERARTLLA